jgi:hypothetical protein
VTPVTFPERTWGQVSTEVAKGTPEDEQKSDNERHPEGDPQPSLAWLAAGHMDNPGSYNPNASHTQEDQKRYVLRHRNEPGRRSHSPAARNDPHLPETDPTHHSEKCASTPFTREEEADSYDDNDSECYE